MKNNNYIILSIIIPVYNGEKFINNAICSINFDIAKNIEIIIVDDASSDNTKDYCNNLIDTNKIITYFRFNKNHGVGAARNKGISLSRGKYITFLDCDDQFDVYSLNIILNRLNSLDIDLAICSSMVCNRNKYLFYKINDLEIIERGNFIKRLYLFDSDKIMRFGTIWGKIYNNKLIKQKKIKFNTKTSLGEDTWFNINYIKEACSIILIPDTLYIHRNVNENSLTKQFDKRYLVILLITFGKYIKLHMDCEVNYINFFIIKKFVELILRVVKYYSVWTVDKIYHFILKNK